ncbi:hypothetical protein GF377_01395 [candidate division GN15 bacterium]|nr:hypothetical protein [candidate division GN15 bacterium]
MSAETRKDRTKLGQTSSLRASGRGDHCVNVYVSHTLKRRLKDLAVKYDRTMADIVRAVLRMGIPMLEGMSEAEEVMVKEYVQLFRRLRRVKALKDI